MTWVAEFWCSNGLSPVSAYLSQWEDPGVQGAHWWRGSFTASDLAVTLAALILLYCPHPVSRNARTSRSLHSDQGSWNLGWSAMVVFGVATAASDLLPMRGGTTGCGEVRNCMPSPGPLNIHSWIWIPKLVLSLGPHTVASVVSGAALAVAVSALTIAARSATRTSLNATDQRALRGPAQHAPKAVTSVAATWNGFLVRYGPYAVTAQIASSVALAAAILLHTSAGIVGRIELSTEAAWLALLALSVFSQAAVRTDPQSARWPR
jgi:hypothetical protein